MMRIVTLCLFCLLALGARAQTLTITADRTTYDPAGGQVTFTATITYPAGTNSISKVVVMNGGSGYTSAPIVSFPEGGGKGAAATATVSGGKVTAIALTAPGGGYTRTAYVSLTGGGGSGAVAYAQAVLPGAFSIRLLLPDTWNGFVSETLPPGASTAAAPQPGDKVLEWSFWTFPANRTQFTFVASYPAGLKSGGEVSVDPTESIYLPGNHNFSVPNISFSPAPVAALRQELPH